MYRTFYLRCNLTNNWHPHCMCVCFCVQFNFLILCFSLLCCHNPSGGCSHTPLNIFMSPLNGSIIPHMHIRTKLSLGQQLECIWDLDQNWVDLDRPLWCRFRVLNQHWEWMTRLFIKSKDEKRHGCTFKAMTQVQMACTQSCFLFLQATQLHSSLESIREGSTINMSRGKPAFWLYRDFRLPFMNGELLRLTQLQNVQAACLSFFSVLAACSYFN